MSDIVEELRSAADTGHDSTGYVMDAAAAEIERLRAAVDAIEKCTRYPVSNAVLAHAIAVKVLQPKEVVEGFPTAAEWLAITKGGEK